MYINLINAPKFQLQLQNKLLLLLVVVFFAGCTFEKKNWVNRRLQNLTARYNVLFNAKELIRLKEVSYATSFKDNYNEILNVYPDTVKQNGSPDKDLETAIAKANKIIYLKSQSNYIGDAYMIIGKAYFLEGNYFNADEYFGYVIRTYPNQIILCQEALTWKARSLMYLNYMAKAKLAIDSAINLVNYKKRVNANVFETKLQYDINVQDYEDAEQMAISSIKYNHDVGQKLRLNFILGQILEINQKPELAFEKYRYIARSNASFEMAFNASLNSLRTDESEKSNIKLHTEKLLSLLKNPNNKEFKDQIYFQVAELKYTTKQIDTAIKYYGLSAHNSFKNQSQKGLSYLKIAEIYFKNKADYLKAKAYYDSTLTTLPSNYPNYNAIQKMGKNLQLLGSKLQIITREDTLQALAKMEEKPRQDLIEKIVKDKAKELEAAANAEAANKLSDPTDDDNSSANSAIGGTSTFYFYNTNAVSQGYIDFKQKWGNIKLDDNWRRSSRTITDISETSSPASLNNKSSNKTVATKKENDKSSKYELLAESYGKEFENNLPLSAEMIAKSNELIYNTYLDLGNIYRDVMNNPVDAIVMFKRALSRFPELSSKPLIYYSLYRLLSDSKDPEADDYKKRLLKEFPNSVYAGVLIDQDYLRKLNNKDQAVTNEYDAVFDLYSNKQYADVLVCVPEILKQYPSNKYAAQLSYLNVLALGHMKKIGVFTDSLRSVLKKYPNDKLIAPIINQHLKFIEANQKLVSKRDTALVGDDPSIVPFSLIPEYTKEASLRTNKRSIELYMQSLAKLQARQQRLALAAKEKKKPTKKIKRDPNAPVPLYSMPDDSIDYVYVINVHSGNTNLASSRFGIGLFNRTNFDSTGVKHQLMDVGNDNQLIYVGTFPSLGVAKMYSEVINPLLPQIMKMPKDKYNYFIITKENLKKLIDKKTLDSYIEFYNKKLEDDN